jgi:polysaccharide export outer membrane protein
MATILFLTLFLNAANLPPSVSFGAPSSIQLVPERREGAHPSLQDAGDWRNTVRIPPARSGESTLAAVNAAGSPPETTAESAPVDLAAVPDAPDARSVESKPRRVPDDYQIGAGDVLQIAVWKEPDASVPSAVVRPDGKIAMPLLKEIEVLGLTPTQVEQTITERISKYIPGADVTVVVSGINSKKIYVVGAVRNEGPIPYTYRMTVMQAISEAGGLTDFAKRKRIYVLRTENGKAIRLPFDYTAVLKGERMDTNVSLLPNDTLVVPR